jgi:hypothetical protein
MPQNPKIYGVVKLTIDAVQDRPVELYHTTIAVLTQDIVIPAETKSVVVDITKIHDWRNFWTRYGHSDRNIIEPEVQDQIYPIHTSLPSHTKTKLCCGGKTVPVEEYFNIYWEILTINEL